MSGSRLSSTQRTMGLSHGGYNPSKVLVTLLSTSHDPSSWPRDIVRPTQWRTTGTQLENDAIGMQTSSEKRCDYFRV